MKRKRRICVTEKEAENGLQRIVKQSSRSETVKRSVAEQSRRSERMKAKQNSRNGKQAISD